MLTDKGVGGDWENTLEIGPGFYVLNLLKQNKVIGNKLLITQTISLQSLPSTFTRWCRWWTDWDQQSPDILEHSASSDTEYVKSDQATTYPAKHIIHPQLVIISPKSNYSWSAFVIKCYFLPTYGHGGVLRESTINPISKSTNKRECSNYFSVAEWDCHCAGEWRYAWLILL